MKSGQAPIDPGSAQDLPRSQPLPRKDAHGRQIGVGGAHSTPVQHGDTQAPRHAAGEGHQPGGHGSHRRSDGGGQVYAPVPGVGTLRIERPNHRAGHGPLRRAGGRQQRQGQHEGEQEQHVGPRPLPNLAGRADTNKGFAAAQAEPALTSTPRSRPRAMRRRSSGRKGLVMKASAPPRPARSRVSSCA